MPSTVTEDNMNGRLECEFKTETVVCNSYCCYQNNIFNKERRHRLYNNRFVDLNNRSRVKIQGTMLATSIRFAARNRNTCDHAPRCCRLTLGQTSYTSLLVTADEKAPILMGGT